MMTKSQIFHMCQMKASRSLQWLAEVLTRWCMMSLCKMDTICVIPNQLLQPINHPATYVSVKNVIHIYTYTMLSITFYWVSYRLRMEIITYIIPGSQMNGRHRYVYYSICAWLSFCRQRLPKPTLTIGRWYVIVFYMKPWDVIVYHCNEFNDGLSYNGWINAFHKNNGCNDASTF